jgi:hypothetical protein
LRTATTGGSGYIPVPKVTAEELDRLTSKAVRSGVSASVAREVRQVLTGGNKKRGRSEQSGMDIGTYTPKDRGPYHDTTCFAVASSEHLCIRGF